MVMGFTSRTLHLDWQSITKFLCKGVQKHFNVQTYQSSSLQRWLCSTAFSPRSPCTAFKSLTKMQLYFCFEKELHVKVTMQNLK